MKILDVLKFDGSLPPWEAAILLKKLPLESRTVAAAQGGDEFLGWTMDRHLQASVLDAINTLTYVFVSANSKKKPKPPKPVSRPGDAERKREAKQNNPFALTVKATLDKLRGKKTVIQDDAKEA